MALLPRLYTVSFIVTGIIWMNHHNFLKLIDHTDHNFIVLNLLLLLCVAFIPFPTRVLAEHLTSANDKVAATAFYGASVTLTGVMFNLLWRYATATCCRTVLRLRRRSQSIFKEAHHAENRVY
ncbi:MAG: TMEM175 family protein [bacterium]